MNPLLSFLRLSALFVFTAVAMHVPLSHAAESEAANEEFERGPHRGRLLRDGDFALEVTIFETGVAPQFRLHVVHLAEVALGRGVVEQVDLRRRLGGLDGDARGARRI